MKKKILVDPKYSIPNEVTSSSKLGPGITCAKFLGTLGSRTQFEKLYAENFFGAVDRNQIFYNLILHANAMVSVLSNLEFAQHRLSVTEGVYEPNSSFQISEQKAGSKIQAVLLAARVPDASYGKGPDGWVVRIPSYTGEKPTSNSINDLRRTGQTIVYQLIDKNGKSDPRKSFDLAVFWKDYLDYDKLTLDYDTFDPSGELTCSIVLQMPKMDSSYEVSFKYELETTYNGELQTKNELLEILP